MIILASNSEIRKTLLTNAGVSFSVRPSQLNEEQEKKTAENLSTLELAAHLAKSKALSMSADHPAELIIAADQTLEFEKQSLTKAKSIEEARQQLRMLRGKTHKLHAAVTCAKGNATTFETIETAELHMRDFSDLFLDQYLATQGAQLLQTLGCYKLEMAGIQLFSAIVGNYFAILGLPLLPLLTHLRQTGDLEQ